MSAPLLPALAVLGSVVSLCVGSSYAKTLFPVLGPAGTTAMRLVVAAAILLAAWRPWRTPLARDHVGRIAVYGAVLGTMNLLFYLAIARIPLGIAIAIEFTGPLTLALAASRRLQDVVWVAFAVLGIGLLLPIHAHAAPLDPAGIGFALGAAVCWALYIVAGQRAGVAPAGQATAYGMAVGAAIAVPAALLEPRSVVLTPALLAAGVVVGVLSSAVPYTLEMYALRRLPKGTFGILLSMEPAVGALVAVPMLREVLTPVQGLAIAAITVATIGATLGARPTAEGASPASPAPPAAP